MMATAILDSTLENYSIRPLQLVDVHIYMYVPSTAMRFLGQSFDSRDTTSLSRMLITRSAMLNSKA